MNSGDLIIIRPGDRIPVDGVVLEGYSSIDEAMLTGESLPVEKGPEAKVYAGTINKNGSFTFTASAVGKDTALARIVQLVQEAHFMYAAYATFRVLYSLAYVWSVQPYRTQLYAMSIILHYILLGKLLVLVGPRVWPWHAFLFPTALPYLLAAPIVLQLGYYTLQMGVGQMVYNCLHPTMTWPSSNVPLSTKTTKKTP